MCQQRPRTVQVAVWDLLTVAGTLTLVGLMESIAIAKALAAQHKHPLNANQELIGAPSPQTRCHCGRVSVRSSTVAF